MIQVWLHQASLRRARPEPPSWRRWRTRFGWACWTSPRPLASGACVTCRPEPSIVRDVMSYYLKVLREMDLAPAQKSGRWVDYTLAGYAVDHLQLSLPHCRRVGTEPRSGGAS